MSMLPSDISSCALRPVYDRLVIRGVKECERAGGVHHVMLCAELYLVWSTCVPSLLLVPPHPSPLTSSIKGDILATTIPSTYSFQLRRAHSAAANTQSQVQSGLKHPFNFSPPSTTHSQRPPNHDWRQKSESLADLGLSRCRFCVAVATQPFDVEHWTDTEG